MTAPWVPLSLAGLAVGLLGVLGAEYQAARDAGSATPAPTPPALVAPAPTTNTGQRGAGQRDADTILARPVFTADRRPPAAAAGAAGSSPSLPRLTGVVTSAQGKFVIFATTPDAKPVVVAEGSQIAGYTVQSITAGQATLRGPDGVHVLRPAFDPATPVAAAGPPRPAAPSVLDLLRRATPTVGIAGLSTPAPVR